MYYHGMPNVTCVFCSTRLSHCSFPREGYIIGLAALILTTSCDGSPIF